MDNVKCIKISDPKYSVRSSDNVTVNCFDDKKSAIGFATEMAVKYQGVRFSVVKKKNHKQKVLFSFLIDSKSKFKDKFDFYKSLISVLKTEIDSKELWK